MATCEENVQSLLPASLGSLEQDNLTAAFNRLRSETRQVRDGTSVTVSLKNVKHAGASFVGMLLQVYHEARRRHVHLRFSDLQPEVREVLFHCRLDFLTPPGKCSSESDINQPGHGRVGSRSIENSWNW